MKSAFSLRIAVSYALLSSLIAVDHASASEKPNILFLITDQQTAGALSCAGNPYVKTPNLDRLAARGVRFEKSYCTYPLCCPSRGSLFSSRMAHELGIYGNFDAELSDKDVPTMGDLFRAAGYETAYAGKWHLQAPFPAFKSGKIPGFEVLPLSGKDPHTLDLEKEGKGLTVDPNAADAAIRFLKQPHERPFLLVASILNPHDICEFPECEALRKLVPSDSAKLPPARSNLELSQPLPSVLDARPAGGSKHPDWNERQWQEYFCAYCRLVEMADAEVGRVLKGLDDAGLASSTVVVFTSDHGEMMGSHRLVTKQYLYDESAAVPLIVAPLGGKSNVDREHLVSGLDILPTVLDYAGIPVPQSLRGRSLRPLVEAKEVPWREFVVSENISGIDARMVRTARFKYIRFAVGDKNEQFFDMEKDPGEMKNLAGDSSVADEVAWHRRLLADWMKETGDAFGLAPGGRGKGRKASEVAGAKAARAAGPTDRASLFERKDKDHDGHLSREEFMANQADAGRAEGNFQKYDRDKDGSLSRDEFVNMGR